MRFEWNEDKNRRNLAKHKISFEKAKLIFENPHAVTVPDRVVYGEERWLTYGLISGVLIVVAHTFRDEDGGEVIRLISARMAIPSERQAYAENQQRPKQ